MPEEGYDGPDGREDGGYEEDAGGGRLVVMAMMVRKEGLTVPSLVLVGWL